MVELVALLHIRDRDNRTTVTHINFTAISRRGLKLLYFATLVYTATSMREFQLAGCHFFTLSFAHTVTRNIIRREIDYFFSSFAMLL